MPWAGKMRTLFFILLLLPACRQEDKIENAWWIYRETGGWIQPRGIDLDPQGYGFLLTTTDTLPLQSAAESLLIVNKLAGNFPDMAGYYEAEDFRTDQNYVTIIRRTEATSDTVQVYDSGEAVLPPGLKPIIQFFQDLYLREITQEE